MYISEALVQKHQRRGPKQTGKFLTVIYLANVPADSVKSRMLGGRLFQIRGPATAALTHRTHVHARIRALCEYGLTGTLKRNGNDMTWGWKKRETNSLERHRLCQKCGIRHTEFMLEFSNTAKGPNTLVCRSTSNRVPRPTWSIKYQRRLPNLEYTAGTKFLLDVGHWVGSHAFCPEDGSAESDDEDDNQENEEEVSVDNCDDSTIAVGVAVGSEDCAKCAW